jgi:hypothetical protein
MRAPLHAGVLRHLHSTSLPLPRPHRSLLIDPRLLAWLAEPQLVQRGDKELEEYGLVELASRYLPPGDGQWRRDEG